MKRSLFFLLAVASFIFSFDARPAFSEERPVTVHQSAAGTAGKDGWFDAKSTGGKFSLRFPTKFDDYSMDIGGKSGEPARTVHYLRAVRPAEVTFNSVRTPNFRATPIDPDVALPGAVKVFKEQGTLTKENRITYAGRPALDYEVKVNGKHALFRLIVFPQSIITLAVESTTGTPIEASARRFFESLRFEE